MKDLILRILNEFKWNDETDEPDLPEKKSLPRLEQISPNEHHYHTHGGVWHIRRDYPVDGHYDSWAFTHEDYDGAPLDPDGPPGDHRHGHAKTLTDAVKEVDDWFPETHDKDNF